MRHDRRHTVQHAGAGRPTVSVGDSGTESGKGAEASGKESGKMRQQQAKRVSEIQRKAYTSPSIRIVKLDSSKGDPKVQSFSDGKKKYGKK